MIKGYYFITDLRLSKKGNESDVQNAVETGVSIVQYRNKVSPFSAFCEEAKLLKKICKDKALFIVNDRIDAAIFIDADGVHLGQEDMPYEEARKRLGDKKIIGVTVHNTEEALYYEKKGANYLGVSPIFSTTTKKGAGESGGIELVKEVRKISKLPIVAIGGIDLSNAREVIQAGADSICAISAVVAKDDVAEEIKRFQALFKKSLT
ncbi:MAG: thiamine phosphate synthase [Candidatus Omnitrophota bacterium]